MHARAGDILRTRGVVLTAISLHICEESELSVALSRSSSCTNPNIYMTCMTKRESVTGWVGPHRVVSLQVRSPSTWRAMASVYLESSITSILVQVPRLAPPSTAHEAPSPVVVGGISDRSSPLGVPTGRYELYHLLGAVEDLRHSLLEEGPMSSSIPAAAFQSCTLASGASHVRSFLV